MIPAAWICLLSPLAATLLITLGWNRLSRRGAGYLATLSVAVSFVAAIVAFAAPARRLAQRAATTRRRSGAG